jgi:hypothetical protein
VTGRIIAPFTNVKLPRAGLLGQRARHGNIQDGTSANGPFGPFVPAQQ